MANRFPLVIDTSNGFRISELPEGDNLNLANSDISEVENVNITGNLVVQGTVTLQGGVLNNFSGNYNDLFNKPVLFSGNYNDLSNKPSIPTRLTDLGISDGVAGAFLTTNGNGVFSFQSINVDYNNLSNAPDIPQVLTELGIADGSNGQALFANGNGTFEFRTLDLIQNLFFNNNTITPTNTDGNIVLDPNGNGYVRIQGSNGVVIPAGTSLQRGPAITGSIRFNTENSQFEGYNGSNWTSMGGVRDVDGDTFIRPETTPGTDNDSLEFFTAGQVRAQLNSSDFTVNNTINTILQSTTTSTSAGTGALTVSGGVGIGENLNVAGQTVLASAAITDLTSNRIVLAGTNGELEDNANLTFDGTTLTATANVDINGDLNVDNININENTISSTNTNGGIIFETTGTGIFDFNSTTATKISRGTEIERPLAANIGDGAIRYNETAGRFEGTVSGNWTGLGGVVDIDQDTYITAEESADDDTLRFYVAGQQEAIIDAFGATINNININGNTISSTDTDGNIILNPNGAGTFEIQSNTNITGNVSVSGTSDFNDQVSISSANIEDLTSGRVVLAGVNGELEDNANLTFDGTDLTVTGNATVTVDLNVNNNIDVNGQATMASANIEDLTSGRVVLAGTNGELEDNANLTFDGTDLTVTGNTTVTGTIDVNGQATMASLNVEDLTSGRVILAGTNGEIEDNANLTFDGTDLTITGNAVVTGTIDVNGQATMASANVEDLTEGRMVVVGVNGELSDNSNLTYNGTTLSLTGDLSITGDSLFDGGATITGDVNINGNTTIGNQNTDTLSFVAQLTSDIIPQNNDSHDLGTTTQRWQDLFLSGTANINDYTLPIADGSVNQIVKTNGQGQMFFDDVDTFGGNRIYVSASKGDDNNDGITAPVATIKRGVQLASELAYVPTNSSTSKDTQGSLLRLNAEFIAEEVIEYINVTYPALSYDEAKCRRDIKEIIDSAVYDLRFGGNSRTVSAGLFYFDGAGNSFVTGQETETVAGINYGKSLISNIITNTPVTTVRGTQEQVFDESITIESANTTALEASFDIVTGIIGGGPGSAPSITYGTYRSQHVTVMVATGDYIEQNPIIVADDVSIVGDNLRRVIVRPAVANRDMMRVRNSSYVTGLTFRDAVDGNGVPSSTFRYAVSFDNPTETITSRAGYVNLPTIKPKIFTSPYIQNCSVISFLGGNGVEIDGNLVDTPNTPPNNIEAENPVNLVDGIPEQGKSMVANAFTILSFGGNAWRVMNDAYAQIVSCFVIFTENGCITQNGGYLSITNSASNFGLFALRSTGYSQNSFEFDRGIISKNGIFEAFQSLTAIGLRRPAIEHFVIRIKNSVGTDITDNFNNNSTFGVEASFTPSVSSVDGNTITFPSAHGFSSGDIVEYDANGNLEIVGLLSEVTYYASVINSTQIQLYHDEAQTKPVRDLDSSITSGTHYFRTGYEEFYINEVVSSHNTYQDIVLPSGPTYSINIGDTITATNGGDNISAAISAWEPSTRTLTVSIELVQEGLSQVRNKFTAGSIIDAGEVAVGSVTVSSVQDRSDLYTSEFTLISTRNRTLQNIANTNLNQIFLHRPSICNSSAHTWEYAGSGTDYNALPQNGGQTDEFFEQVSTLPGRVYTSGTNELGDFKVGDFVRAFNRTGNIDFRNKVSIGELDSLALSLSSGVVVNEISTDIELGDNEVDGAKHTRLVTQLAARTFLDNRLGNFIDKNLSSNAVPNAVVQLNSQGQINPDLIPPQGNFNSYTVNTYDGRLELHNDIPVKDLRAGDIVVETYNEITLTLTGTVSVTKGETITQAVSGATGVVKETTSSSNTIKIVSPYSGTFNTTNELSGSVSGSLGANSVPTVVAGPNEVKDNYFLATSRISQYLILDGTETYDFTDIIANETPIKGAVSGAVATVDSHVVGVLTAIDIVNDLPGGSGYSTPGTYTDVDVTNVSGSGTGAKANITVGAGGQITSFDITRGGSGYSETDVLSVSDADVGGRSGGSAIEINVTDVENRLYITLNPDAGLEFSATTINLDFIKDDNVTSFSIGDQTATTQLAFNAADIGSGGNVDYANETIVFGSAHGYTNGDPVEYDSNTNVAIGGLSNGNFYYVKVIDSTTIELYNDYALTEASQAIFGASSSGNHILRIHNVSTAENRFYYENHGLVTGDAVRVDSTDPAAPVNDEDYLFVGGVTTNSFTLHQSRGAALDSVGGLLVSEIDVTDTGSGSVTFEKQNVTIIGDANTSGQNESAWSSLSNTTVDATNIISGIIDPSRLGIGSANNDTFLRGDSTYARAVQGIKNSVSTDPITLTGSNYNDGSDDVYYGVVDIRVENASYQNPAAPSAGTETKGVAAFDFDHFEIDANGKVTTKSSNDGGVIDADTLDGQQGSYYLNPVNFTRAVPIERGGTNITSMLQGDILYAATDIGNNTYTQSMSTLSIGSQNDVLVSTGTAPAWSSELTLTGLTVDNIQIGISGTNEIDTVSGNLVIDSAGGTTTIDDNLIVSGNLTVNGTTTTINSATLTVDDLNIVVASGAADASAANGAGLTVDGANATLIYASVGDQWEFNKNLDMGSNTVTSTATTGFVGNASTATAWLNPRTFSLTGNVTGTISNVDGTSDVSITTTVDSNVIKDLVGEMVTGNTETGISVTYQTADKTLDFELTADPIITLSGDVSGSGTMTNLTSVNITTTVADNSHNHVFANISDGTVSVQDIVGAMVSGNTESGIAVTYDNVNKLLNFDVADFTVTLSGDVSGSATVTDLGNINITSTVANNSHTHLFANITDGIESVQDVIGAMVSGNTESGITVTYDDNTGKLNFDVADPTITLTGDVSGSVTMTNLGNVTINTTVADNSHNHVFANISDGTASVEDIVGAMVSGNTEAGIAVTYDNVNRKLNFNVADPTITITGAVTGSGTMTNLGNFSIDVTATSSGITDFAEAVQDVVGAMVSGNTESGITVTYDDTNGILNFDVADPTITLTGDVTGSTTMTNLGNVTINATVANDSHSHVSANITDLTETVQDIVGTMVTSNTENGIGVSYDDNTGKLNFDVADFTVTLSGDASGSATITDLGNATLNVTVNGGNANTLDSLDSTQFLRSDASDAMTGNLTITGDLEVGNGTQFTTFTNTSNGNVITFTNGLDSREFGLNTVDGLWLYTTATQLRIGGVTGNPVWHSGNDGAGSGLDADTIDGIESSELYKKGTDIPGSADLNTYTTDGYYHQNTNANALSGTNYPTALAGMLEVVSDGLMIYQTYHVYDNNGGMYRRTNYNGTWYTWKRIWDSGNDGAGSGLDADTVDGLQASNFVRSDIAATKTGDLTMAGNIIPSTTTAYNMGTSSVRWNTMYATTFDGTATRARYADLAEIYSTDIEYEPGTVVMFGGEAEVTASQGFANTKVAGIISTDPAYLMNSAATGQPIALKGRVPCKVIGKVEKGDMLVSSDVPGVAIASKEWIGGAMIGKAIESSDDDGIKIIEVAAGVL